MTDGNDWRGMRSQLEAVKPRQIAAYLAEAGWRRSEEYRRGQLWELSTVDGAYEVFQPEDGLLTDYLTRVADLIETISVVENRSTVDVLAGLAASGSDVQYYSLRPASPSGTIPLTSLVEALDGIRKVNIAAAYSELVSDTPMVQPSSKPQQVHDFVRGALVGPSRPGSYVVSVRPTEEADEREGEFVDTESPSHRISNRLTSSISSAFFLARSDEGVEYVEENRLSANLLDALAAIGGKHDPIGFSVRVGSAAVGRAVGQQPPIVFEPTDLEALRNWAENIRAYNRSRKVIVEGHVIETRPGQEPRLGSATLHGEARGVWGRGYRHYEVELPPNLLAYAAQAQRNRTYVTVEGQLAGAEDAPRVVGVGKFTLHES